jgi:nitronate monooxygenase
MSATFDRTRAFCERLGVQVPIFLAPMAGASAPSLSIAVANAGGLGSCGVLPMEPQEIHAWTNEVRVGTNGGFQLNIWIPDPPPFRDAANEARWREFLSKWGPDVPVDAADTALFDFNAQCEAMLAVGPKIVSSVMGLYPSAYVSELNKRGILWFATATTVAEARAAEAAGADAIVAQGMEAGGHRGAFEAGMAESRLVGLFALLPAIVDAVRVPVIATGGIADARGVAAALALGASAVQIGSAFLRCPEAKIPTAWADALGQAAPEDTVITRAFSGRPGRALATDYVRATTALNAPPAAPYPIQRGLTAVMRGAGQKANDISRIQAWGGQASSLGRAEPAGQLLERVWKGAQALLA